MQRLLSEDEGREEMHMQELVSQVRRMSRAGIKRPHTVDAIVVPV